jgi:environmental stress-induced protein Ves
MVIYEPVALDKVAVIPWRNGGGTTRTLAVEPAGAGLDDFDWRISLAEIHAPGSFSAFPGVERTILLWRGQGVVLRSPAWPEHRLTGLLQPFRFDGEDEVDCRLIGDSSSDLNLMVRRGRVSGKIHSRTAEVTVDPLCDDVVVICSAGVTLIQVPGRAEIALREGYFLRISRPGIGIRIVTEGPDGIFVSASMHRLVASNGVSHT